MAFKDYIATEEARVAMLVTETEQHILHALAGLGTERLAKLEALLADPAPAVTSEAPAASAASEAPAQ